MELEIGILLFGEWPGTEGEVLPSRLGPNADALDGTVEEFRNVSCLPAVQFAYGGVQTLTPGSVVFESSFILLCAFSTGCRAL